MEKIENKKNKKICPRKIISFILIFSILFTQNGSLVFANTLKNEINTTLDKYLYKDISNQTEDYKPSSNTNTEANSGYKGNYKYSISPEGYTISETEDIEKNMLKTSDSGELLSVGNLGLGKAILPEKLPKLVKGQLPFPDFKGGYYYNQLDTNKKIAYQVYLWLIENVQPLTFIDISPLELDVNDFYAIHQVVLIENPEIFHARGIMASANEDKKIKAIYYLSAFKLEEIREMKKKLDDEYKSAVANIRSSLKEKNTRLDIIRAIHDYIGKTTYGAICEAPVHPTPDHFYCAEFYKQHSIYGVFVDRRSVCEGNSYAFAKLAKEFGVPVLVDKGTYKGLGTMPHAWNFVQMEDNKWYIADATLDGVTHNQGINKFNNFLIGEERYKNLYKHDPYLLGYNMHVKAQVYEIPELSQENYVKINVEYPSRESEFYKTFKEALEDIRSRDLSGTHKILLTDNYKLTSEEVEMFRGFENKNNISFEISSIKDNTELMMQYSLKTETGDLYLSNDTKFSNINYEVSNLYTQGNKVSFLGDVKSTLDILPNIYLGQKKDKVSDIEIESGSFNKIYLAKDYKTSKNNNYSNDINFKMTNGSIKELYISDTDTITGNININISNLSSIDKIYYGENISINENKNLDINIGGGEINQIVSNEKPIDANVNINLSAGKINRIEGPTVKSTSSTRNTKIVISGGEIVDGVYGELGNPEFKSNNNILIKLKDLKNMNIPNISVARSTTGKGLVEASGISRVGSLTDFDEVKLLDRTYLKIDNEIEYSKSNKNRLGKLIYSGSISQLKLPPKETALKSFENSGNENALLLSKNNAYLTILEDVTLNEKLILKYFNSTKAQKGDKLIKFPKGYNINLNNFTNQIDKAYPLEVDKNREFLQLGDPNLASYIDTIEGRYPYEGDWGKEHKLKSETSKDTLNSTNQKSDEIVLEEGKLPYKDFKGGYYYDQLTDLNRKIAYQLYYYISKNLDPDEFLYLSNLNLDQNDFYGTFDIVFHENPEIFWARDIVVEVNEETNKVTRIKYYSPFSKDEISEMKDKFDKGIKKAIDSISSNLTDNSSKLEKVKAIHDYLIKNNHYGSDTCPETEHPGIGHLGCRGQYIEHSAYGAFVKTPGYGVVCEGFGTAFILLSKHFGIEALFDAGQSKTGSGFHLWNYVKMEDNKWYLLDLTYDNGYLGEDEIAYNLFLVGKNDPAFNYKHDKYLSGLWNDLSQAQTYDIPEISNESYIKFEVIYPDNSRNVFRDFDSLLDDLKNKNINGTYKIILRDNYSLTKQEVQKLRDYTTKSTQIFDIQSLDESYMSKPYSLKSETNKIYFPMEVIISNISYDIENTYSEGGKITVGDFVEKSNTSTENNIYLMPKQNGNLSNENSIGRIIRSIFNRNSSENSSNEISIESGFWGNVIGVYSENGIDKSYTGTTNISIVGGSIKELILSEGAKVKGDININISKDANIENFKYGENIDLSKDKNIKINISGGKISYFEANENPISANTTINVTGGEVDGLMGPVVFSENSKNTTTINITSGKVGMIVGGGTYDETIKNNNDIVIDIKNIKNINSIAGILHGSGNSTIKINSEIEAERVTDFDNLIIGNGGSLKVIKSLDYNQMKSNRDGLVEFLGGSKLILPEVPSIVGKLKSTGTLNKIIMSKEEAYLNINEKQDAQGSAIGIDYEEGLLPQNGDEILRYKYKEDINLDNFINEVDENFALYNDEETGSVRIVLANLPIKVSYKDGQSFEYLSLIDALEDVEQSEEENASEVVFYINEDYEMTEDDLIKLESYSGAVDNQKFVFTSEVDTAVLSTSDDVIFPSYNKLNEIEFRDITLDFNKNIFASGSHLIIDESVKMTDESSIDLYGGLFETEVTKSKLTLNGGTFNNVYGGGLSSEGRVLEDVTITLDKNVLVKKNVYGGAESDRTGTETSEKTTTINLLGGTVEGDIIGGGKNNKASVFNKIAINYGDADGKNATNVKNIYGLFNTLDSGSATNNIDININKNANFKTLAGFSSVVVKDKVTLDVSDTLKYDAGISSNSEGKIKLLSGSNIHVPNSSIEDNRKIGNLEIVGLSNIHINKDKYLLIDKGVKSIGEQFVNISYSSGIPELNDKVIKFSNKPLTNNKYFKTKYDFNISSDTTEGVLYLSQKTYEIKLYTDNNTLYKTDEVESGKKYTFAQGPKIKGKKFIKWKDINEENVYYSVGESIDVTKEISVIGVYEEIEEYTVTLKVDGLPYKTDYVEEGDTYTFTVAPPKPEKYFIGWKDNNILSRFGINLGKKLGHSLPGTTITVKSDLTFDADYGKEVKFEVDYGDENGPTEGVYYEGGKFEVPSKPPINIAGPLGMIFGGFKVIGSIIGGIAGSIFKPGSSITVQPGIKLEAVWVEELTINLYDKDDKKINTEKIGKGFDYTLPKAPIVEDKVFLHWQDKLNPNNKYSENQKIEVNTNMELKAVYKPKIVSISVDNSKEEKFTDLKSALEYFKDKKFNSVDIKFLENYSLTNDDINTLRDFDKNNVNFVIKGAEKNIELAISNSIRLSGNTKFENIVLDYGKSVAHGIYARGHKLEMGENVTMKSTGAPTLIGGDNGINVSKSEIIVRSGRYKDIYGAGYLANSGVKGNIRNSKEGNINIELHGGEITGDIYGGSQNTGKISGGETTIKLIGGTVGGIVSGSSKVSTLESSNNVSIYLSGTKLKNGKIYAGFPTSIREVSNYTGENTIYVEKPGYNLHTISGFRKLDIKSDVDLTVTDVLNHKGGINPEDNSGEVSLNGNSTLTIPSTNNVTNRQVGWLNSKGDNNKIVVNKNDYLILTSSKDDEINKPIVIDLKNPETDKTKVTLLKYEANKSKANAENFVKGKNVSSEAVLKSDETDGTVYIEEKDVLTVTKPSGESLRFKTIRDGIEKISEDTQTGEYVITLLENYSLTNEDMFALRDFNRNNVNFVIKGLTKETELKVNNSIDLPVDTKFENITLDYGTSTSHGIYARGHKLEMGDNIKMKNVGGPILIGGANRRNVRKSEIIVRSGVYPVIYGGGYASNSGVEGNINIELHGGEITGDIYAGGHDTGRISGGKTTIKLIGGTIGGIVSGTSKVLGLDILGLGSSNNVNIHLSGTKFKTIGRIFGGFATSIREVSDFTGENTIYVENGNYELHTLAGFRKLELKPGANLTVTNVLNHKGGVKPGANSGEVSLNGNSTLTIPSTSNVTNRQAGWLSSKGDNNKIVVNKNDYLNLTSSKEDEISTPITIELKNPETDKKKVTLVKYESNKSKANEEKFVKGANLPSNVVLKSDKTDGTVYMEENYFLTITKPNGELLRFKTIKDGIEKIKADTQSGTYTITLVKNYVLTNDDIVAFRDFNRNNASFVIKGSTKETELAINNSIGLSGNTKFENITLDYGTSTSHGIYARGHKLEMGENVKMKNVGGPVLIGGYKTGDVNNSEIIVRSGTYPAIYGGGYSSNSGVKGNIRNSKEGNINIELHGGEITGDIYGGSQSTGKISGGETTIKLIGGTVGGIVSGSSKVSTLESSNNVSIYLSGTKLKNGKIFAGFPTSIREVSNYTGENTIYVEKPGYNLHTISGFRKLDIKSDVDLTVTDVLNHKGGINPEDNSGEVSLNGNSTLTIPSTNNVTNRQVGWLSSKGDNNKIVVNKNDYLILTSSKDDEINKPIVIDFKNPETDKTKVTLLKYEANKSKANEGKFVKGSNLPNDVVLKSDKADGTVYMEEKYFLTITKPNGESLRFKTIKDGIEKISADTQTGEYVITLLENYSLTNEDMFVLRDFNRNNVSFVIKGLTKETELKVNNSIDLPVDTKFENITLDYGTSTSHGIYARGHKLEMGDNIKMKNVGGPILIGGANRRNVRKSEIIVRSGIYPVIYGGGYASNSGVEGNINIELHGGEITGDIYAGGHDTGRISGGKTTIKLIGGTIGGIVSGTSKVLGLDILGLGSSNNVNIHLAGTKFKTIGRVFGGFATSIREVSDFTGENTIYVENGNYELHTLAGFRKLELKPGANLTVTNVLNHKGGVKPGANSGEVSLNGNSTLTIPSTNNVTNRQAGWLSSKGDNNKIVVNKNDYLNLTSSKEDEISTPITIDLKNPEIDKTKVTLVKYEANKSKADASKFIKGDNITIESSLRDNESDGTVYLYVKKVQVKDSKGTITRYENIEDAFNFINSNTNTGEYEIGFLDMYKLSSKDINAIKNLNRKNLQITFKGLNKESGLIVTDSIHLSSDTKFEDMVLDYGTSVSHGIYARGHRLEMGDNISMKDVGGPILIGGENGKDLPSSEIVVRSGTYPAIYGAGYSWYNGINGDVQIDIYGGNIVDIYGGSRLESKMTGSINIRLIGGTVTGVISGASQKSGLDSLSDVSIYLQGTSLGRNVKIYGGFVDDKENRHFKGKSNIRVEKTGYSVDTVAGFDSLNIFKGNKFEVRNKLNHIGGITNRPDSGELILNGRSTFKIPSSSSVNDRQIGWIRSNDKGNKIIFSKKHSYLNLTSTRSNMHSNYYDGVGYPVELDFENMINNMDNTNLIRYQNNKNALKSTNFILGKNLGLYSIFGIDGDKLYSVIDPTYLPEESYMMVVQHTKKILGVQNSKKGANALQLTHAYGQHYGPYEDYSYWSFKKLDNGNYKIVNNKSNLLLTVKNGSLSNGAFIVQQEDINDLSQQWKIEIESYEDVLFGGNQARAYYVVIRNAKSGKVLDVRNASYSDGAPFIQYDYKGSNNQRFLLVKHIGKPQEQ